MKLPVTDALIRRGELEAEIGKLLQDFTAKTGLVVEHIEVDTMEIFADGEPVDEVLYGLIRVRAALP